MTDVLALIKEIERLQLQVAQQSCDDDGNVIMEKDEQENAIDVLGDAAKTMEDLRQALFLAAQRLGVLSSNAHAHMLTVQGTVAHMWASDAHKAGGTQPCPPHPTLENVAVAYKQATATKSNQDA